MTEQIVHKTEKSSMTNPTSLAVQKDDAHSQNSSHQNHEFHQEPETQIHDITSKFNVKIDFTPSSTELARTMLTVDKVLKFLETPPPEKEPEPEPEIIPQIINKKPKKQSNQLEFEFANSDKITAESPNEIQKTKKPSILSSLEKLGLGEKEPKYDNHFMFTDQMIKIINSTNRKIKVTTISESVAEKVASNIRKVISKMPIALVTSELSAPLKTLE